MPDGLDISAATGGSERRAHRDETSEQEPSIGHGSQRQNPMYEYRGTSRHKETEATRIAAGGMVQAVADLRNV
jgi:hypothetical protein